MLEKYITLDKVFPELESADKQAVLTELSTLIANDLTGTDAKTIANALSIREELDSTGIESGIAIPHAKVENILDPVFCIGRSRNGVNFNSHDGKPVYLFFVLLVPTSQSGEHIKVLARLAKLLSTQGLKEKLITAVNAEEIYSLIIDYDKRI